MWRACGRRRKKNTFTWILKMRKRVEPNQPQLIDCMNASISRYCLLPLISFRTHCNKIQMSSSNHDSTCNTVRHIGPTGTTPAEGHTWCISIHSPSSLQHKNSGEECALLHGQLGQARHYQIFRTAAWPRWSGTQIDLRKFVFSIQINQHFSHMIFQTEKIVHQV